MIFHARTSLCGLQPRRATAAVELAVCLPVIAVLIIGLLQVGRIVQVTAILNNAAREGGRNASTGTNTYANVQTVVQNYLTNAGITNQTGLTISVNNVTQGNAGPNYNPSAANWMDQLQVTVTLPLSNVSLAPVNLLPASTVLSAQAVWFSNQDQAYPTTITPPSGS
jgi:Flp pilus assembly protein TadG